MRPLAVSSASTNVKTGRVSGDIAGFAAVTSRSLFSSHCFFSSKRRKSTISQMYCVCLLQAHHIAEQLHNISLRELRGKTIGKV